MLLRALTLPDDVPGRLWLSPMPGRLQPWVQFVAEGERCALGEIVCLTPLHEVASLSFDYHRAIVEGTLPWRWRHVPMRDFGLSANLQVFREALGDVADDLRAGQNVLLHCAAGIGRTGTAAACLLKRLGLPADEALRRVRNAGSDPQSAAQSGLIDSF